MSKLDEAIEMLGCAEYNLETNYPKLGAAIVAPVVMQIKEALKLLDAHISEPDGRGGA